MTSDHSHDLTWRKSSHSSSNGQCVEIAHAGPDIAIRDSKNPDGPVLLIAPGQWHALLTAITAGDLSLR
jgi:hypothetical protein